MEGKTEEAQRPTSGLFTRAGRRHPPLLQALRPPGRDVKSILLTTRRRDPKCKERVFARPRETGHSENARMVTGSYSRRRSGFLQTEGRTAQALRRDSRKDGLARAPWKARQRSGRASACALRMPVSGSRSLHRREGREKDPAHEWISEFRFAHASSQVVLRLRSSCCYIRST